MTRQMPPWHLDKTVGIQEFQNNFSLSDEQISTIVALGGRRRAAGRSQRHASAQAVADDDGWQLAKQFGQPDLVLKSEPTRCPLKGQDVWFKPLTAIPITESRWVRAVEMRPATPAGRKITHHALATCSRKSPERRTADAMSQGLLMEWAVNKNYDIYRPDTGKLLLPGCADLVGDALHAVGEEIRDHVELAVYLYPEGRGAEVSHASDAFRARPAAGSARWISRRTRSRKPKAITCCEQPARLENFQPHMHLRGKAMPIEAILPDGTGRCSATSIISTSTG